LRPVSGVKRTLLLGTLWTAAYAVLHSILAGETVKDAFKRRFGETAFNGIYRLVFNVVALLSFAILLRGFRTLSGRTLYAVPRPWSFLLRLVQLGAALMALDANIRIGLGRMLGVQGFWEWLRGEKPIVQNPAQGPQLTDDLPFRTGGSFSLTRHPNNLVPFILFWANPRMTLRFLVFTAVASVYLVLGSAHEETRLGDDYGRRYSRYRKGIPFYFPRA
jgi:protein-S-isoprenylcysteine O-methyltransferase Ste14